MSIEAATLIRLLPLIPLLPLLGAAINGLFGARMPRWFVTVTALGVVFASFCLSVAAFIVLVTGQAPELRATLYTWMSSGSVSVSLSFLVNHLSAVMILVVTGVGFLIHLYSVGYMSHDPSYARYFAYLNLFTFAMLTLVLADSLPLMFLGWEGVGLCSYLLIGFWFTDTEKASAGKKAFVVNRIGDFGFIVAMMLLLRYAGTLEIDALQDVVKSGAVGTTLATAVCLMLFLGATGKSAQLPLYIWLPDAMAGPTPVSALIHAATMVTAGVYMVARLGFLFALAPVAMLTVAGVGAATAIFAATIGTAQNDIKKVLAYSTVSQLGFMFLAAGVGAYAAAVFHLVTHAFFKACLFLGSGSVIHGMSGEQDIRQMGGLRKKMPITFATFFVATLAITGFPATAGFVSKDAVLWHAFASSFGAYGATFAGVAKLLWGIGAVAAGFTAFYMWRLVFLTFFSGELRARPEVAAHVHESPWTMTLPLVLLALLSLVGGAIGWPHLLGGADRIATWLAPVVGEPPVHGEGHVGLELFSMGTATLLGLLGFGLAFFWYARRVHPVLATLITARPYRWLYLRLAGKWHVDELYDATVVRPLEWASRVVLYEAVDKRVIDGSVNAVGWAGRSVGFLGQLFQTGSIQKYLAIFAVALAVLLYGWLTPTAGQLEAAKAEAAMAMPSAPAAVPPDEANPDDGKRRLAPLRMKLDKPFAAKPRPKQLPVARPQGGER